MIEGVQGNDRLRAFRRRGVRIGSCGALLLLLAACTPGGDGGAIARGDAAWARGDREEALAEYRLALRQGDDDADVWLRVGHAYSHLGRVDEAREPYREAITRDPTLVDQAVADLVRVARASEVRRDRFRVAQAMQLALELQPGISVGDLAAPLARHYTAMGEYARAIPFYQRALTEGSPGARAELTFDLAVAHEQIGDCRRAVIFFEQFRESVPARDRGQADFHVGSCSFTLALEARRTGNSEDALRHIQTVLRLGEPRAQLPRAWFEMGEVLASRGDCDGALNAFRRVLETDTSGNSPLVERAQDRIDQIRFPGRRGQFREGGC